VQRGVRLLGTLRHAAKDFRGQMVRLDARLRTNNNQALDEVAKLANISRQGCRNKISIAASVNSRVFFP